MIYSIINSLIHPYAYILYIFMEEIDIMSVYAVDNADLNHVVG